MAYSVGTVYGTGNSYRSDGVDLEATTDTGGGYDVGWTAAGQWFKYTVNVATAGTYTVGLRLAAPTAVTDALHISNSAGTNLSGDVTAPTTGGYQDWTTVSVSVTLPAGTQTLTINQDAAGWNINYSPPSPPPAAAPTTGSPYGGTPAAVPGTVQAENYDTGGQGVGYSVTSVNGSGNSYRSDGVDLEATTDSGGGYDLGWTAAGQWFKYTVNVATAGAYTVGFRLAAPSAVADALHIVNSSGTNLSGNVAAPATGGYQDWTTVNATVTLPAGTQTLTVDQDAAGWNINYMTFTSGGHHRGRRLRRLPVHLLGQHRQHPEHVERHRVRLPQRDQRRVPGQRGLLGVNGVEESIAQSPYYSMSACGSCGSTSTSARGPVSTTTSSS